MILFRRSGGGGSGFKSTEGESFKEIVPSGRGVGGGGREGREEG